jgi:hypothetical protein
MYQRRLLIKLGRVRQKIANLEKTYDKLTTGDRAGVQQYRTETNGVGIQETRYRSPKEINDQLEKLYAEEESILNALNSRGTPYLNLRRRSGYGFSR